MLQGLKEKFENIILSRKVLASFCCGTVGKSLYLWTSGFFFVKW